MRVGRGRGGRKSWLNSGTACGPKLIDGTTVSAPDTQKNQRAYPQSRSQKPGCGFPLIRLVGVFSLATGVLLDYAKGNKHQPELRLLMETARPIQARRSGRGRPGLLQLRAAGLAAPARSRRLFRLHQRRPADLRKGQRLGKNDRLLHLAQAAPKAPLAAPVLVEENSSATDRPGDSLQACPARAIGPNRLHW